MANDNDMVVRQVGLTFALLASPGKRDVAWVQAHVDGYGGRTREAAAHLLDRDVRDLRRLGVPARYVDGEVWVNKDLYELPPVDLTPEEASVVGLAADLSKPGSLGEFARSGWTKLAASGATRGNESTALSSVSNDIFQLRPETLRDIVACAEAKQRMSFDFVRAPGKEPERREVDPWGVVSLNNRAYFVGYDIDRGAERVFRVKKISRVKKVKHADAFHEPTRPLQQIVEESLRGETVDATVRVTVGVGDELAARGTRDGETITLTGVDRDWAVRAIAALAGNVVSVEPDGVRDDVVKLLRAAAERGE